MLEVANGAPYKAYTTSVSDQFPLAIKRPIVKEQA